MKNTQNRGWLLLCLIAGMAAMLMGMVHVWLGIGRTDIAYEMRKMRTSYEQNLALRNKLEVERERLLAPYALSQHAERLQIREARVGQIRRLQQSKTKKNAYDSHK